MTRISIQELAGQLGLSRRTLYRYIDRGWLTPRRTPSDRPFVLPEDVVRIQEALKTGCKVELA